MMKLFNKRKLKLKITSLATAAMFFVLQAPLVLLGGTASAQTNEPASTTTEQSTVTETQTKKIYAKALNDHECNEYEWHFVINQISRESKAPAYIYVKWSNGQSANVPLDKFTGSVAHYTTKLNLKSTVVSAGANIYSGWSGQFNLSHGPCKEEPPKPEKKGSITIKKDARPDSYQNFYFTSTGQGVSNFALDDDYDPTLSNYKKFEYLYKGTYIFTEAYVHGWDLKYVFCSDGTYKKVEGRTLTIYLKEGQHVTCVFVNKKKENPEQHRKGSITIKKDARPDSHQNFYFTAPGQGVSNFALDDDHDPTLPSYKTFKDLHKGTYTFKEQPVDGWKLKHIHCSEGTVKYVYGSMVTIYLKKGQDVKCEFVNEKKREDNDRKGSITIKKDARPDSSQDFYFKTTGYGLKDFALDDDYNATLSNSKKFSHLKRGTYTVSEKEVEGWKLKHVFCSDGTYKKVEGRTLTIYLKEGQHVTCVFVNEEKKKEVVVPGVVVTPPSGGGSGGGEVLAISTAPVVLTGGSGAGVVLADTGANPALGVIAGALLLSSVAAISLTNQKAATRRKVSKILRTNTPMEILKSYQSRLSYLVMALGFRVRAFVAQLAAMFIQTKIAYS